MSKKMPEGKKFTKENAAEMGRKGGKAKKGYKSLHKILKELEADKFDWSKTPLKRPEAMKKYGNTAWEVIVARAAAQAAQGDRHAREWLRKAAYGDRIKVDGDTHHTHTVEYDGDIEATLVGLAAKLNKSTDRTAAPPKAKAKAKAKVKAKPKELPQTSVGDK